ncbi:MAG: sigma factor-like helix-turn-helix DNA-binding protein [Clostridia bacterium]|nr:sigma factor-like helix-turn-helix DNA-binding protein [Clostridia bacterium]
MQDILNQIDSYIKRTIVNTVKDFKKYEVRKANKELLVDDISNKINNDKTALLSYMDDYAVFSLNLEDNFEDEQLYKIVKSLSEEQKEILTLSILEEWSSKEIARKFNKSDSRIRHIIRDTIAKIKKDYEEN